MDVEKELLMSSSDESRMKSCGHHARGIYLRQLLLRDTLLLLLAFTNFLIFALYLSKNATLNDCVKMTWAYSPLHDRFQVRMSEHKAVHATLGLGPNSSAFRGGPSPEVDAAWDQVTKTYLYPMTKEEVLKMGNDPDYAVLMPGEFGFGEGFHAGFMDVEHKIHCLDVLRREIYSDYYGKNDSPLWINHVDHCLYILLEGLMCQPNLQLIPYIWMEGHPAPIPDFIQNEKCWDFDDLIEWRHTHGHLNDRNYYGLYRNLRHMTKETPITPDMEDLRDQEAQWKSKNPHHSNGHHH